MGVKESLLAWAARASETPPIAGVSPAALVVGTPALPAARAADPAPRKVRKRQRNSRSTLSPSRPVQKDSIRHRARSASLREV